jgi:hypothetical protein
MKRAELEKAIEIDNRIKNIEKAIERCSDTTFRTAVLVIQAQGHGVMGTDGKPQSMENRLPMERNDVLAILKEMAYRASAELRKLGVEP